MKIEYKGDEIIISNFKPVEAYKIARNLEVEGIGFYDLFLSASAANSEGTRRTIEALLSEEKKHLALFNQKVEELAGPFEEESAVDEVDTKVFGTYDEPADLVSIVKDRRKALQVGMLFEKRSINFFKICLEKTTDASTKSAFENIIKEEERHFQTLKELFLTDKDK
ncbi:MAG: hypothetical protein A2879_04505 [Omnitrophica WOR_2 bacterium RIFCSPHIGHO2_01_FULL_49_10]|nr:MAG: hypothetical protein A2879_04505 [Omnitrophica WOR_2 bacterium RIFCSPHIGHO2_01_FULL_49_10]